LISTLKTTTDEKDRDRFIL